MLDVLEKKKDKLNLSSNSELKLGVMLKVEWSEVRLSVALEGENPTSQL